MSIIFETPRLLARPWQPETAAEQAALLYTDPLVTRYLGGKSAEPDLAAVRARLHRYAAVDEGKGALALVEKDSGYIVGAVLLSRLPGRDAELTDDYQVGWHLRRDRWGKGYATEAGRAALARGFNVLELPVIYALVEAGNTASVRVTARLGMEALGPTTRYYGGEALDLFRLTAEKYHRR